MNTVWLAGIHPIEVALLARRRKVHRVYYAAGKERLERLMALARQDRVPTERREDRDLTRMAGAPDHQGVVAEVDPLPEMSLEAFLGAYNGEPRLVTAVDHVQDPRNLGAICRSLIAFDFPWLILPVESTAPMGTAASKASAGAVEYVQIVRVINLATALRQMQNFGWVWGLAGEGGQTLESLPADGIHTLVVGAEERGLRPGVRAACHDLVGIPVSSRIPSLNASVAASIALYEMRKLLSK